MVDYDKSTGSSGTMRIRDTGSVVEFWITSGNSSTFVNDMPWAYVINGVTSSWREFRYEAGSGFEKLGSWNVTTSQTVTFKLGSTGTSGLGGPTTHSVFISRVGKPDPPSKPVLSDVTNNSVFVTFSDGDNNGSPIDARLIGYGTDPNGVQYQTSSDGSTNVGALHSPGATWYFWARTHNAYGWSTWSARSSVATLPTPPAPGTVSVLSVEQTSAFVIFVDNGSAGLPILEAQVGYSLNPDGPPTSSIPANPGISSEVQGLSPGLTYFFWARIRTSAGWSPWSTYAATATLVAGAYLKVGTQWKRAVPYVKVDGVWRVVRPYVRISGSWRKTT